MLRRQLRVLKPSGLRIPVGPFVAVLGVLLGAASWGVAGPEGARATATAVAPGYEPVGWQLLGDFVYDDPGLGGLEGATADALAKRRDALPAAVRALDGKLVSVRGFAVPADVDGDRVSAFLLLAQNDLDCCFGESARMNQWILVRVRDGERVQLDLLQPMRVSGRLAVGEEVSGGIVLSLYRLAADRVEPAP